jgi:hypothetical protein
MGSPHPAALEAIGIEGMFDAETRKMNAKMLSGKMRCDGTGPARRDAAATAG